MAAGVGAPHAHYTAVGLGASRGRICVAVEAASAETIAGDKRSGAYGHGWIWSKAHTATPAAEGSHRSPHAKSRNRCAAANGGLHALAVIDDVHSSI